jgi:FtsZ-binding cell division protein ZapB
MAQEIEKLESKVLQCEDKLREVQVVRAELTETDKQLQAEREALSSERAGILKQHNMQSKFKTKVVIHE